MLRINNQPESGQSNKSSNKSYTTKKKTESIPLVDNENKRAIIEGRQFWTPPKDIKNNSWNWGMMKNQK